MIRLSYVTSSVVYLSGMSLGTDSLVERECSKVMSSCIPFAVRMSRDMDTIVSSSSQAYTCFAPSFTAIMLFIQWGMPVGGRIYKNLEATYATTTFQIPQNSSS